MRLPVATVGERDETTEAGTTAASAAATHDIRDEGEAASADPEHPGAGDDASPTPPQANDASGTSTSEHSQAADESDGRSRTHD